MTAEVIKQTKTELAQNESLEKAIVVINKKLDKLGAGPTPPSYRKMGVNLVFISLESSATWTIHSLGDVQALLKIRTALKRLQTDYHETAKEIGLTKYPEPMHGGVLITDWLHDLDIRINMVANQNAINDLKKAKADLETFMSKEQRLQSVLDNVKDLLK